MLFWRSIGKRIILPLLARVVSEIRIEGLSELHQTKGIIL